MTLTVISFENLKKRLITFHILSCNWTGHWAILANWLDSRTVSVVFKWYSLNYTLTGLDEFLHWCKGPLQPLHMLSALSWIRAWQENKKKIHLSHTWQDCKKDPFMVLVNIRNYMWTTLTGLRLLLSDFPEVVSHTIAPVCIQTGVTKCHQISVYRLGERKSML